MATLTTTVNPAHTTPHHQHHHLHSAAIPSSTSPSQSTPSSKIHGSQFGHRHTNSLPCKFLSTQQNSGAGAASETRDGGAAAGRRDSINTLAGPAQVTGPGSATQAAIGGNNITTSNVRGENNNNGGGPGGQGGGGGSIPPGTQGPAAGAAITAATKRRDRPCDACRKRKSRCVLNEGQASCVLCQFHSQQCTFVQSPAPRKRRNTSQASTATASGSKDSGAGAAAVGNVGTPGGDVEERSAKKRYAGKEFRAGSADADGGARSIEPEDRDRKSESGSMVTEYSQMKGPSLLKATLGLQKSRHAMLIGPTSEYEECLISLCTLDSKDEYEVSEEASYRRVSPSTTFLVYPDSNVAVDMASLDKIESLVAPHGPALINLYFRIVHPSFPILHKRVFLEKYSRSYREFSPPLLAAVYCLACKWWSYAPELSGKERPDINALEEIGKKTLQDCIVNPKLSTVQAGLLLLQRHIAGAWALTAQMVAVGQDLGLNRDPSGWKIPAWEKGLRKRLSWALFMQDKWAALTHGRPSHIVDGSWDVPHVSNSDFPETKRDDEGAEDGSVEIEKGRLIFEQMIKLSRLTAAILEAFFTDSSSSQPSIKELLDRAKPIQIRLREWYASLPAPLKMDTASKPRSLNATGALHLSYFATEITLHRILLRSTLTIPASARHLPPIIRSAAKTRLISALDFINRLTPSHLQSFWPSHSRAAFSLVAAFGALLWASSPTVKEGSFYLARLKEYRWTLRVSLRSLDELRYPLSVLEEQIREEKVQRWKDAVTARNAAAAAMANSTSGPSSPNSDGKPNADTMNISDNDQLEQELEVGMIGFGGDMGGFVGFGGFQNQSRSYGSNNSSLIQSAGGFGAAPSSSSTGFPLSSSMPTSLQTQFPYPPQGIYSIPGSITNFSGFDDDGAMGSESEDAFEEFEGSGDERDAEGEGDEMEMDLDTDEMGLRRARERGSGFLMMPEDSS